MQNNKNGLIVKKLFENIILKNPTELEVSKILRQKGMLTMKEDALLKALQKGGLGGAGLDVLEEECYVREDKEVMSRHFPKECDLRIILENHALAKMGNVIITPHNAFNSVEALQRILDMTIENIKFFLKKKIVNEVN